MTRGWRVCVACGASSDDAVFPPDGRAAGVPTRCIDCVVTRASLAPVARAPAPPSVTRATCDAASVRRSVALQPVSP